MRHGGGGPCIGQRAEGRWWCHSGGCGGSLCLGISLRHQGGSLYKEGSVCVHGCGSLCTGESRLVHRRLAVQRRGSATATRLSASLCVRLSRRDDCVDSVVVDGGVEVLLAKRLEPVVLPRLLRVVEHRLHL
eukprot:2411100-Prymnesium_polylepis.1